MSGAIVNKVLDLLGMDTAEEAYDEELLEELVAYNEIYLQPNRKKCALLPAETIEKILQQL